MSNPASRDASSGEQVASSTASTPVRSDDPAWNYALVVPGKKNQTICMFCNKSIKGGKITRFKQHLAGQKGDTAPCQKVDPNVKWQMKKLLNDSKMEKENQKQRNEEIGNPDGTPIKVEGEEEDDFVSPLSSTISRRGKEKVIQTGNNKKRKQMTAFFQPRTTPGAQKGIKSALASKEMVDAANMAVCQWWFDANIPFNAARSKFYQPMADAIMGIGPGYKMPSYHDLRGALLKKTVTKVIDFLRFFKKSWSQTGCSIMVDGWTDGKQTPLINFFVYCPKGVMFLKSVDTSGIVKNADGLFKMFDEVVAFVGPSNVVQFITDNEASYKAAGRKLVDKYDTFYWTPCAAHCIDLILEDIAKPDLFPINADTIEKAKKITKFIYNHGWILSILRKDFTNGRDIVRTGMTRFATNFLSLQSLYTYKGKIRKLITSDAWENWNQSSSEIGLDISDIILNSLFWRNVEHILKVSEPLVKVLRLVDSEDRPAMGYLYEAMDRAKETIEKNMKKKKSDYMPYWRIIDQRWDYQMHSSLHAAGYFLNPQFFYSPRFSKHREINKGLNEAVSVLEPNVRAQIQIIKQLKNYKHAVGQFGTNLAIAMRDQLTPASWWEQFGDETPELKKFAVKVLSQCCSSSGCERNWSIFEHIHSKKRNILEHQRLNDLVFVHYNLKLRERFKSRKTSSTTDPISLENIDILAEWVCEEPALLTEDDVRDWELVEQPAPIIVDDDERITAFEELGEGEKIAEDEENEVEEDDATNS